MTRGRPGRGTRGHRGNGRRAGARAAAWLVRLVVLALVFLTGLVVGRAVEDAPQPGGTQTIVRTLEPLTVQPEERTVTGTAP